MFRSIPRRQREAAVDVPPGSAAPFARAIQQHLEEAARIMRTSNDPEAIADSIDQRPADEWGDDLDRLRDIGNELGRVLRELAAHAEPR